MSSVTGVSSLTGEREMVGQWTSSRGNPNCLVASGAEDAEVVLGFKREES